MLRAVPCCTHHCRQTLSFCLVCINLQKLHANTTNIAECERLLGGCSETISVKFLQNRNEFLLNGGKPYSTWNLECHSPNVCQVKPNAKRYTKKTRLGQRRYSDTDFDFEWRQRRRRENKRFPSNELFVSAHLRHRWKKA